jgi:polyhydroxyalkanoate synthesis regulator phasin
MARLAESSLCGKREGSHDHDIPAYLGRDATVTFVSEALRASQSPPAAATTKAEEKVSLVWRIFGGSIISVCALVVIQAYQVLNAGLIELRSDQSRMRELATDFVKKGDMSDRTNQLWTRVQELHNVAAQVTVATNKLALVEQQLTAAETERKELAKELNALRERLAKLEGAQKPPTTAAGN